MNSITVILSSSTSFNESDFANATFSLRNGTSLICNDLTIKALPPKSAPIPPVSKKTDSTIVRSDDEILSLLRKLDPSVYAPSDSNTPWFETLFPNKPVPTITDSSIEKAVFNVLFSDLTSKAKTWLKSQHSISLSHLPRSIAVKIQEVILRSAKKSSESKVPTRILKKAAHLTPSAQPTSKSTSTATSSPDNNTVPPKAQTPKAPRKSASNKNKSQAPPPKTADSTIPKSTQSARSPSKPSTTPVTSISDVNKALAEAASPAFYFAKDKTPTFQELFPGTSMPKHSRFSGNVRVEPSQFSPLLSVRIKAAHAYLSKRSIKVTKLPSKFLAYQTRLICRSIETTISKKKEQSTAKKQKKIQSAKAQPSKAKIQFIPGSTALPESIRPDQANAHPDTHDVVRDLRDLRMLMQSVKIDYAAPESVRDPRLHSAIRRNSYLPRYIQVPSQNDPVVPDSTYVSHLMSERSFDSVLAAITQQTSMSYESILSSS
jgi:hypothetical protein